MTPSAVGLVVAIAAGVVVAATLIPAVRAARTSTARALDDTARTPRRSSLVIAISAQLPTSLLLGLRLAGRRPRRIVLQVFSIAVTMSGIVAVLVIHAVNRQQLGGSSPLLNPEARSLNQVTLILTIMLVTLAAVNAILITWATVIDARRASAIERAIGATPGQISAGLLAAQLLPALAGALIGVPGGIGLYTVAKNGGPTVIPPALWIVAAVLGALLALVGVTAIPARIGAHRPISEILASEQ
jgi:putative ABC transport system permease protein